MGSTQASLNSILGGETKRPRSDAEPRRLSMNEVTGMIDLTQNSVEARNKTQNTLTRSLANEVASEAKELFEINGLSKITNETEMKAAILYCAKRSGNFESVSQAMINDPLGSLITAISQRIVKLLSIKDRTLRRDVSYRSELIWMIWSFTCKIIVDGREYYHTLPNRCS